MKFGVIVFPGSNCDRDVADSLEHIGYSVDMLWHKNDTLGNFDTTDCIVLPGGFSYGDYLRCGALASHSAIMQAVKRHAQAGGYVLGICNGFQMLCETQLLPGALLRNAHQNFICKNTFIKPNTKNKFLHDFDAEAALKIPIAHGEGRYYCSPQTLQQLQQNNQIAFTYCNQNGTISEDANPNGSLQNIAGITNSTFNVLGMMPHPERAVFEALGNTDGKSIFNSIVAQGAKKEHNYK